MSYDFETKLEDAIIAYLGANITTPVLTWSTKKINLSPVILVQADEANVETGTWNTGAGIRMNVQISAFTSTKRDKNSRIANAARAEARSFMSSSTIVTDLNALMSGLQIYENGVIPTTGFNSTDGLDNNRGFNVEIVVVPI